MIIQDLPKFKTEKELFDHIVENEDAIFTQAKMELKKADGFGFTPQLLKKEFSEKGVSVDDLLAKDVLESTLIINTTNVIDSHKDLHIPGLWDKSLKENKRVLHLEEHKRGFANIISKGADLKAYAQTVTWKSLGFDMEGKTEALTFDSNIRKSQHAFMHEQYAKGNVDEHSVGMQYVKMITCINDEDYPVQKENWDKYIKEAANPEALGKGKIFWAVTEAKVIEGSAVPLGSNSFTPTQSIKADPTGPTKKQQDKAAILKWLKS